MREGIRRLWLEHGGQWEIIRHWAHAAGGALRSWLEGRTKTQVRVGSECCCKTHGGVGPAPDFVSSTRRRLHLPEVHFLLSQTAIRGVCRTWEQVAQQQQQRQQGARPGGQAGAL